jgi:hypothetical protein
MKIDYLFNGSVALFTGSEMMKRHAHCDIGLGKDVTFIYSHCEHASSTHSIQANNVLFQTAIVNVLHVPRSVHEPLARGSVNYNDARTYPAQRRQP